MVEAWGEGGRENCCGRTGDCGDHLCPSVRPFALMFADGPIGGRVDGRELSGLVFCLVSLILPWGCGTDGFGGNKGGLPGAICGELGGIGTMSHPLEHSGRDGGKRGLACLHEIVDFGRWRERRDAIQKGRAKMARLHFQTAF